MKIPCVSLWQPWGSLVILGLKQIETRSWGWAHRGPLAIHAAKSRSNLPAEFCTRLRHLDLQPETMLRGCIIGVVDLVDIMATEKARDVLAQQGDREAYFQELAFGDYTTGRRAWVLARPRALVQPIPCTGRQRIWTVDVPDDDAAYVDVAAEKVPRGTSLARLRG